MKKQLIILILTFVGIVLTTLGISHCILNYYLSQATVSVESPMIISKVGTDYARGVNDALQTITLLDLEVKLNNERKTWGEMNTIVRLRLGVKE